MAKVQARKGNDVVIYSAETTDGDTFYHGYHLHALKCICSGRLRKFEFLGRVASDLRRNAVDIIHFHSMPEGIWFLRDYDALKILSYDFFRSRSWRYFPFYGLYRWTLQQFDWLFPVSEFCLEESAQFWKLTMDHMRVLHNGVNLEQFRPDNTAGNALRDRFGLGSNPVILYIGRVCEQKGTDVLIDAYIRLKQRMPQVRFVVAGPAEQFGNEGSSPMVECIRAVGGLYLGAIEESELAALYNLATVFVMATRRDEMFGMAAIEAQACGKLVVCSRQGGLPEVIPETSGIHFAVGNSKELATTLERVLTDQTLYDLLSKAARENATRFSWDAVVRELEEVCSEESRLRKL
jgi:glycosyltransferase involved in cell wall biosynthesis